MIQHALNRAHNARDAVRNGSSRKRLPLRALSELLLGTMLNCVEICRTVLNYVELCWTMLNHAEPHRTTRRAAEQAKLARTIQNYSELLWTIYTSPYRFREIWPGKKMEGQRRCIPLIPSLVGVFTQTHIVRIHKFLYSPTVSFNCILQLYSPTALFSTVTLRCLAKKQPRFVSNEKSRTLAGRTVRNRRASIAMNLSYR